jgi:hypothetical protein
LLTVAVPWSSVPPVSGVAASVAGSSAVPAVIVIRPVVSAHAMASVLFVSDSVGETASVIPFGSVNVIT